MAQLSELFNVNHFIVSQINPHGVALSSLSSRVGADIGSTYSFARSRSSKNGSTRRRSFLGELLRRKHESDFSYLHTILAAVDRFLQMQLRCWAQGFLKIVSKRQGVGEWFFKRGLMSLFLQNYEGRPGHDVSILPWNNHLNIFTATLHLLDVPRKEEFRRNVAISERNAWPKLPRIQVHCGIEGALERCVQLLRRRLELEQLAARREFRLQREAERVNSEIGKTFSSDSASHAPPRRRGSKTIATSDAHLLENVTMENVKNEELSHELQIRQQLAFKENLEFLRHPDNNNNSDSEDEQEAADGFWYSGYTRALSPQLGMVAKESHPDAPREVVPGEVTAPSLGLLSGHSVTDVKAKSLQDFTSIIEFSDDAENSTHIAHADTTKLTTAVPQFPLHSRIAGAGIAKTSSMANFYYRRNKSTGLIVP